LQLRVAFDREGWVFREHGSTFVAQRRTGWRRMPGLPIARGILETRDGETRMRVTIRLAWLVYVFGGSWMAGAIAGSALAVAAAIASSSPTPMVVLVLPIAGWLVLVRPFRSEARLIRERLADVPGLALGASECAEVCPR